MAGVRGRPSHPSSAWRAGRRAQSFCNASAARLSALPKRFLSVVRFAPTPHPTPLPRSLRNLPACAGVPVSLPVSVCLCTCERVPACRLTYPQLPNATDKATRSKALGIGNSSPHSLVDVIAFLPGEVACFTEPVEDILCFGFD
jgi:hypothetical protein